MLAIGPEGLLAGLGDLEVAVGAHLVVVRAGPRVGAKDRPVDRAQLGTAPPRPGIDDRPEPEEDVRVVGLELDPLEDQSPARGLRIDAPMPPAWNQMEGPVRRSCRFQCLFS